MAVSFKLNNVDFPPLSFPNFPNVNISFAPMYVRVRSVS